MKKLILIFAIFIGGFTLEVEAYHKAHPAPVSFNFFYSSLSPYGEWIEVDYGLYAWRPMRVVYGWSPYTRGRWIWTNHYGWYWDSFEPFGWAVYHYGRWYYDDYYGWIWIPDNEWGPAWVEWRYSDDYIGWAPLPPYAVFSISIGIRFTTHWHSPYHYWHFIPYRYFCGYEVNNYLVGSRYKYRIYNNSKYRSDYGYERGRVVNRGLERDFVERRSGSRIVDRDIVETTRLRDISGSRDRDRVTIYRPGEDDLKRSRTNDIEVTKLDRNTSLETSRVEIGRRERTEPRSIEREVFDRNPRSNENERNREIKPRVEERETERNSRVEPRRNEEPRYERPNVESPRIEERPRIERKEEPRRYDPPKRDERPRIENKQPDVRTSPQIERRSEPRQTPPAERRVEPRREENRSRDMNRDNSKRRNDDSGNRDRRR
ncbi:MAG: hypothetical protein FJ213_07555 [Ignavibacteria bacterium]|nr:hypothetical protein [Ignavibacteria bacterium]